MKTLHINVSDKIATYRQRDGLIVCGNSDYQIQFTFDSEWDTHTQKTARFIWAGQYVDVDFEGDVCPVPIIQSAEQLLVGVYAGELSTTTPAFIDCKKSILCEGAELIAEERKKQADRAELAAERAEVAADRAEDFEGKCIKDISVITPTEGVNEVSITLNDGTSRSFIVNDGKNVYIKFTDDGNGNVLLVAQNGTVSLVDDGKGNVNLEVA